MNTRLAPAVLVAVFVTAVAPLVAQWPPYPTMAVPRTTDGKPNLTAPAPRTADGKPDLTGMWQTLGGSARPVLPA